MHASFPRLFRSMHNTHTSKYTTTALNHDTPEEFRLNPMNRIRLLRFPARRSGSSGIKQLSNGSTTATTAHLEFLVAGPSHLVVLFTKAFSPVFVGTTPSRP